MFNAALVGEAGLAPVELPDRETSLLLCLIGAQLRWLTGIQCADALSVWVADLTTPILEVLEAEAQVPARQFQLLARLASEAVEYFEGDAARAFDAFGGEDALAAHLRNSGSPGIVEGLSTAIGLPKLMSNRAFESSLTLDEKPGRYTRSSEYSRGGMGRILVVSST